MGMIRYARYADRIQDRYIVYMGMDHFVDVYDMQDMLKNINNRGKACV